jgi:hypothetical protein|uniref:KIB1-4 beta-propeller domain-containing protein n=1 Tax=Zea mays TaxID=4577 RepID=A0A804QDR1_MAIZE
MADWSSLPAHLVNRIADRLLATDELDYYMDLRAVCRGWRSSTTDPKSRPLDPRFRPHQWAMLHEVHQSDERLFVNAGTGRFVRRYLPLLRRYIVVAGAAGGSVVLAERTAPHAARVLNPFTGAMISFDAPVPPNLWQVAAHVIGSSPTLVLLCKDSCTIYWADPCSGSFMEHNEGRFARPLVRLALESRVYAAAREGGPLVLFFVPDASKVLDIAAKLLAEYFSGGNQRFFLVESGGEILIVVKLIHGVVVFKIDTGTGQLELVKNLGSRALFVGDCRCLSVDADKFASVEANCVYYVVEEPWFDVCVYSLSDKTEVRAGGAIDSLNPITLSVDPPFSEVQLLCCYTFMVQEVFAMLLVDELIERNRSMMLWNLE